MVDRLRKKRETPCEWEGFLLLVHVHVGTVPLIIIRRRDEMGGAMGGWMGSIILHPPPRPIPDVEYWETLLLQAMRRGSYLALALLCAYCGWKFG